MSGVPDLVPGDGLVQNSVQAIYRIDNVGGAKPGSLSVTYRPHKGTQFASLFLGTVPKLEVFDLDKLMLKTGWCNTDQLITAMLRAGFTAPDAAKVTQELLNMEDEP